MTDAETIVQLRRELDEARKSIEQWKYEATKWEGLHDLIADELIFEQTRDSIGPTEELPDTVRRIIKERDYLQSELDACTKSHQRMNADNERLEAENEAQRQTIERLAEALASICKYPVHSEPVGGACAMQDIAHAALEAAGPLRKKSSAERAG